MSLTYTPASLRVMNAERSMAWLVSISAAVAVWIGAAAGALQALWWSRAPRALSVTLYIALGWALFAYLPEAYAALSASALALLVVGGCLYTIGAVVYGLRRPDPAPRVFGYHEIFHACVVAAVACHFVAITAMVRGS